MILPIVFAVALAQVQATPPPPAPPRPIAWPAIAEKKLANGLTLVLAPLPNVPKINLALVMLGGNGAGVAQLAGRVALEGTATRGSREIKEELRSMGGAMNADVDHDATTFYASSLSEFSPRLLERYQRLRNGRWVPAVVAIEHGICAGCHLRVPPSFAAEVRTLVAVHTCPHCARMVSSRIFA